VTANRQLDDARIAIARYLAEQRAGKRGIHGQRIRVIKNIERISANLQVHAFVESVKRIVPDEFRTRCRATGSYWIS
jgi:hypothetical protein